MKDEFIFYHQIRIYVVFSNLLISCTPTVLTPMGQEFMYYPTKALHVKTYSGKLMIALRTAAVLAVRSAVKILVS